MLFTTPGHETTEAIRLFRWEWLDDANPIKHDPRHGLVVDFRSWLVARNFARRLYEAFLGALPIRAQNHSSFRYTVQQCSAKDFDYCYALTQYDWPQFKGWSDAENTMTKTVSITRIPIPHS